MAFAEGEFVAPPVFPGFAVVGPASEEVFARLAAAAPKTVAEDAAAGVVFAGVYGCVVLPAEDAQDPSVVAVAGGQDSKAQSITLVAPAQTATTPWVKPPHPAVMSETRMPGTFSRSDTMEPFSMS